MKLTKKQAYEIARTVRPDVLPTTTRDLPLFDLELMKHLGNCWCFLTKPTRETIGAEYFVAVNKETGKAFQYSYGE